MSQVQELKVPSGPTGAAVLTPSRQAAPRARSLTPASIAAGSRLLSDFVLTDDILLNPAAANPLAVFQNAQGQSEALAVHVDGLLYYVYRDSGASGWNLREVGGGMQVSEVVADRDMNMAGAVRAVFVGGPQGEAYTILQNANGTWSAPQDAGYQMSNLGITGIFEPGAAMKSLAVCGVATDQAGNGNLVILLPSGPGQPGWAPYQPFVSLGNQPTQLVPGDGNWMLYTAIGERLACAVIDWDFNLSWTYPSEAEGYDVPALAQLVTIPGRTSILLALDNQDQLLWTILPLPTGQIAILPVSSMPMAKACVTQRADDPSQLQVYALDTKGRLWVIRQNGTSDEGVPVFLNPVPLGDNFQHIATPPNANTAAEVLALDTGGVLHHLFQDPVTTRWTQAPIRQPAQSTPQNVSRYHTAATVYDASHTPVPNAAVTITASAPTSLWIDGATYYAAPGSPVPCATNAMGRLTVASPAFGLNPAQLTFNAGAGVTPLVVNPALQVHDFLRGAQPLNGMTPLDTSGTALVTATVTDAQGNQVPLAPTLANIGDSSAQARLAGVAASGIVSAMDYTPGTATGGIAGWALSVQDLKNPTFQTFSSADALRAHRAARRAAYPPSDAWSDIGNFIGDVWHGIETTAMAAFEFTVDMVGQVMDVTLTIEGDIVHLADLAIHDLGDVVSVIQGIFAAIGADIEDVIAWLQAVFNWHDIWNTKQVFEHLMLSAIPALQSLVAEGVPAVEGFFAGLKDDVGKGLDVASGIYQGQTIADISQAPQRRAGGLRAAAAQAAPLDILMQSTEAMWVWGNVFHYLPQCNSFDFAPPVDLSDSIGKLKNQLDPILQDLENAVSGTGASADMAAAYNSLHGFFDDVFRNPQGLPVTDLINAKAVPDLLTAVTAFINLALDLLDGFARFVLDLLNLLLSGVERVLTHVLDIPLISWLYRQVQAQAGTNQSPQDLTIVGLCALLLAAPATAMYKASLNNQAPFDDDAVAQILAWSPSVPSGFAADRLTSTGVGDVVDFPPALTITAKVMYGVLSVPLAALDVFLDGLNPPGQAPSDQDPAVTFFSWADVVNSLLLQCFSVPTDETWFVSEAEQWTDGVWLAGLVLPGVNAALLVPPMRDSLRAQEWGKVALSLGGAGVMGCGIAAAVKSMPADNGWDIANAILSPIDNTFQFLRLTTVEDSSDTISLWAKLALNVAGDLGSGVANGLG